MTKFLAIKDLNTGLYYNPILEDLVPELQTECLFDYDQKEALKEWCSRKKFHNMSVPLWRLTLTMIKKMYDKESIFEVPITPAMLRDTSEVFRLAIVTLTVGKVWRKKI